METTLGEVLNSFIDYRMENVYTAIPGIILAVHKNGEDLLVDVQPSVSLRTQTDEIEHRPVILNVPVQMPSSSTAGVLFPVNVKDTVLMVFSMSAIDNFKYGDGRPAEASDFRKFNIRDAVAIPGVYPKSNSVNRPSRHRWPHNPEDLVVYHNLGTATEVEVRLKKNEGSVIINTSANVEANCKNATVNASEQMEINTKTFKVSCTNYQVTSNSYTVGTVDYGVTATGTAATTGTFNQNGSFVLNGIPIETHTHGGVQSGGSNTGGPQ